MTSFFSIIIPVYNVAPYLRECLDSVLAQTFTDWECICIDDGSTDGSGEILDEYTAKDSRFRVFHQQNAGVSAARNKGLDEAQGEWLYFVDGDDAICSETLRIYAELVAKFPAVDVFFFPDMLDYAGGKPPCDVAGSGATKILSLIPRKGTSLLGCHEVRGNPVLRLLRSSRYKTVKFPLGIKMMEDGLNLVDILAIPAIFATADIVGYCYRHREGSATRNKSPERCVEVVETFRLLAEGAVKKLGCSRKDMERYWQEAAGVLECYLMIALNGGDKDAAAKCALTYFEIEEVSGMKIFGKLKRCKIAAALRGGLQKQVEFRALSLLERVQGGVSARMKRLFDRPQTVVEEARENLNAEYIKPEIAFRYVPHDWDEEKFVAAGGFVAVVLNYNKKGMIRAAAESALNQDYPIYEIVMLDDASTDGSEKILLETAKAYAERGGKMRVTVCINKENRTIIGQWELARDLAPNGQWFGMFCGDDESFDFRITTVANLIAKYPTVWGVCTNLTTTQGGVFGIENKLLVWRGNELERPRKNFYGCTAFWRRDVLEILPDRTNLDDFTLFWSIIIRRFGDSEPVLLWAQDKVTVKYRLGSGITTVLGEKSRHAKNWFSRIWLEAIANRGNGKRFGSNIWRIISDYDKKFGHSEVCHRQVQGHKKMGDMDSAGWIGRLCIFVKECIFSPFKDYGGQGGIVREHIAKEFVRYFFGPPGYCLYRLAVQAKGWILRRIPRPSSVNGGGGGVTSNKNLEKTDYEYVWRPEL